MTSSATAHRDADPAHRAARDAPTRREAAPAAETATTIVAPTDVRDRPTGVPRARAATSPTAQVAELRRVQ
jgi:hypothetical protein